MMRWLRKPAGEPLAVSMSSVKLADRLLFVGCEDVPLIVALAAKSGLTGRTCIVDENDARRSRAATAVEREGVLVESFTASYTALPFSVDSFDVAVIRNVLGGMTAERAPQLAAEIGRVLRPGGRCLVIEGHTRRGLAAVFRTKTTDAGRTPAASLETTLRSSGFRAVRTLAEREGLAFLEGVKPGGG